MTRLALAAMQIPRRPRRRSTRRPPRSPTAQSLHTWDDLLGVFPGVFGVKTGHTYGGPLEPGVGGRAATAPSIYATILGSPSRARRDADLETLLAYGLAQYRQVDRRQRRVAATRRSSLPYGRAPARARRAAPAAGGRAGRRAARRARRRARSSPRCRFGADRCSDASRSGRAAGSSGSVRSSRARSVAAPGLAGRVGWYAGRTVRNVVDLFS